MKFTPLFYRALLDLLGATVLVGVGVTQKAVALAI